MELRGTALKVGTLRNLKQDPPPQLQFLNLMRSEDGDSYELCTAVMAMERKVGEAVQSIELIATVHLGEEEYFREIQTHTAGREHVLFELVAGPEDVWEDSSGRRRLKQTPTASDSQRSFARTYELRHQLEQLNYTASPGWELADLERATILRLQQAELRRLQRSFVEGVQGGAAKTAARRLGQEATALWFMRGGEVSGGPRRARDRAAIVAGVAVGAMLPAPELWGLLGQWVWQNGGRLEAGVLSSLLELVSRLEFRAARRLQYAQFLVAGQAQVPEGMYGVVIGARNVAVLAAAERALAEERGQEAGPAAVLYGVLHMGPMYEDLLRRGFRPAAGQPRWLRAWTVPAAPEGGARPWLLGVWVLAWLAAQDYADAVAHAMEASDCLRFGAQSVVWSTWPQTEIQVPVTQYLQCPAEGAVGLEVARSAVLYAVRHLWLFWTLQRLLLR